MHQPLCFHSTLSRVFFKCRFFFLQQVICSFRGIQALSEIKKDIEANFKQMKQCLAVDEGSRHEPQLAAHYINWWVTIPTIGWRRWWLMQQQSHNDHMLFSVQDIRNNSKRNISGAVTSGGADGGPSPGRDLHVTVPVLTHPTRPLSCLWIPASGCTGFLQEAPAPKCSHAVTTVKRSHTAWFSWWMVGLDSLLC